MHKLTFSLLLIGGLNWLLVGLNWNLVDKIFGAGSMVSRIIYIAVGLSAVYELATHRKNCKCCEAKPGM